VGRYVLRGGRAGYQRLRLLARIRRADTLELLRRAGIRPGMRCIDLGCGGGEVTFDLAGLTGPGGSVTGVDMDEVALALAREDAAGRGLANVEFRAANVSDWDEPDAYDLVYSRFLVEHLSGPDGHLRRMWRAVRPGGALAVEDVDYDGIFSHPCHEAVDFCRRMLARVCELNGGDAMLGRKLYRYFLLAGIPGPELRLVQDVASAGGIKPLMVSTLEAGADAITGAGLATAAEVAAAVAGLAAFAADPETVIGGPRVFQVWARRR
jgi:2-polyprenyl-3-methyl-5-hydroxy-6-metoxy-1,4-benzoquinol methylase